MGVGAIVAGLDASCLNIINANSAVCTYLMVRVSLMGILVCRTNKTKKFAKQQASVVDQRYMHAQIELY